MEALTNYKQAAIAYLARNGVFIGDHNKALRRRMIEWLTGKPNAPLYACSASKVRDALVTAAGIDVIACGIEANVTRAIKAWAEITA